MDHLICGLYVFFFFNDTATTEIYTLSLHDALPILTENAASDTPGRVGPNQGLVTEGDVRLPRSEEHTSELQSRRDLVCRLLLEKKKTKGISLLLTFTPKGIVLRA